MQPLTITMIRLIALMCIAIKAPIFVSGILSRITWCQPDCYCETLIKPVIDGRQTSIEEWPRFILSSLTFLEVFFSYPLRMFKPYPVLQGPIKRTFPWKLSFLSPSHKCTPFLLQAPITVLKWQWTSHISLLDCEYLVSTGQVWLTFVPLMLGT